MALEESEATSGQLREEVDRILRSEEFRGSEVLRRLLLYLAEKAASGEADGLKEYVVAIDGLGKPSSYDPQHNSAVRIQVGRLRQKLAEYYRNEGINDPVIVDLPKGRFRLVYENRKIAQPVPMAFPVMDTTPAERAAPPIAEPIPANEKKGRWLRLFAWQAVLLTIAVWAGMHWGETRHALETKESAWTSELEGLWAPILGSSKPLVIVIEDPLFVELQSNPGVYFRDRSLNRWNDLEHSQAVQGLGKSYPNSDIQPSRYYTAFGEVDAALRIGRLLGSRVPLWSLAKASQVTWQQLSDNNVVFVGVENLFFAQTNGMPIQPQLIPDLKGVKNPNPAPGEQAEYIDDYKTAPRETGTIYAVVTHLPGPLGSNDVVSFTSNRSAGYVGAVQAFSDPKFARMLTEKFKTANHQQMPRYYQVLLKVKFTDDVPTETTYVMGRELK